LEPFGLLRQAPEDWRNSGILICNRDQSGDIAVVFALLRWTIPRNADVLQWLQSKRTATKEPLRETEYGGCRENS